MPLRRLLLAHGRVVLVVNGIGEGVRLLVVFAALLDEIVGEVEVLLRARRIVQLDERQLDFGVAAGEKARVLFDVEPLVDIVGVLNHRGVQLIVYARLVQGDRRLDEMSRAVQLVLGPLLEDILRLVHLEIAVEIPAGQLAVADIGDRLVRPLFQLRVLFFGENVRNALQPLGDVAVPKDVRLARVVADALHRMEAPRFLKAFINIVHRNFGVQRLQIAEKAALDLYLLEIDRLHFFSPPVLFPIERRPHCTPRG